ncbi:MAG: LytTR family DNA-binding domain-containing protein, partial [Lachnospiraceae bacterium]|nr:LytTR family DNA-binding domain-containing protein [Lachnospiraceae bacterium]
RTVGREISPEIREVIVYISNRLEKVFETFRTSPLRFIRKQYFYEEIPEALAASLEYITGESSETITLELGSDVLRIPLRSIFYIESSNKDQIIMTSAAAHAVSTSMNQLEEELTPKGFIRAHRCYLVNCAHIYLIQQDSILLDNRESIPLSKRRRKDVKEALLRYSQKKL